MVNETRRRGGCGCCGTLGCAGALLLVVLLGAAVFFVVRFVWDLSDQPLPADRTAVPSGTYPQVRHKLDDFMGKAEIRSVLLSEADINAMLEDAPELTFLGKGATIVFREDEAELRFRVPLHLLPSATRYLNYEVFLRPIVSWGKAAVNVSRVTSGGKPLDPTAFRGFKEQAEPFLNLMLTWLNDVQQSRAIQSIRIQNGSVLLER